MSTPVDGASDEPVARDPSEEKSALGRLFDRGDPLFIQALVLAAVTALAVASAWDFAPLEVALMNRTYLSDDQFFQHREVLGPEYRILKSIRENYPPGSEISIYFDDRYQTVALRRITGLWLALLPDYPISSGASLVVCPVTACGLSPGDEVVERGQLLRLVQRRQ